MAEGLSTSKIILVNRLFYPDESATSQLLTDLALHLSESGHQVAVVTARSPGSAGNRLATQERYHGVEISRVFSPVGRTHSLFQKLLQYLAFYPAAVVKLLKLVKRGDVIVVKTDPPLISLASLVAAKAKGAKLVNWIQDLYPEVAIELQTPFVRGPVGRGLAYLRNRALWAAEMNVAIGSRMAQRLAGLGVASKKIAVIANWADETAICPGIPTRSAARTAWGFTPSDFVVGYSGNLGQAHEVETLVGAAKILRHRDDLKFLFIGSGHQHQRLQHLIHKDRLTGFVFKPHQPRNQLSDALAAADVHWVSLRPELEGLIVPSKLYGILAAARPVLSVCDREGEVSRAVTEQGCGLVVQPGDSEALAKAIESLADDRGLCSELGRRARVASEQIYSKASALAAWSDLLTSLGLHIRTTEEEQRHRSENCASELDERRS